jgi:hypothetical protein
VHVFAGTGRRIASLAAASLVGVALAGPARALEGLAPPVPVPAAPEAAAPVDAAAGLVAATAEGVVTTVAQAVAPVVPAPIEAAGAAAKKTLGTPPAARVVEAAKQPVATVKVTTARLDGTAEATAAVKVSQSSRSAGGVAPADPPSLTPPARKVDAPSSTPIASVRPPQRLAPRRSEPPASARPMPSAKPAEVPVRVAMRGSGSAPAAATHAVAEHDGWLPIGGLAVAVATAAASAVSGGADQPVAPLALLLLLSLPLFFVASRCRGAPLSGGVLTPLERPG